MARDSVPQKRKRARESKRRSEVSERWSEESASPSDCSSPSDRTEAQHSVRKQHPRVAKQNSKIIIESAEDGFESQVDSVSTHADSRSARPQQHERERLRICWDIGTTYISVSYIKCAKAQAMSMQKKSIFSEIEKVDFFRDGKTFWISTNCAYWKGPDDRKAKLYLGEEAIEDLLVRKHIRDEDVLHLWKLALDVPEQTDDADIVGDESPNVSIRRQVRRTLERLSGIRLLSMNDSKPLRDIDLVGDVVENIWNRVYEQIRENGTLTISVPDPVIDFVICVPSIWTVVENQKMLSGFIDGVIRGSNPLLMENLTFELCHEPTAAMGYVFSKEQNQYYSIDDTVVIADMGGGSVDVTTVTIEKKFPPMLRQEVTGDGDYCGSVMLNETFRQRVNRQLEGLVRRLGPATHVTLQKKMSRLLSGFERAKKGFDNKQPDYFIHCEGLMEGNGQPLSNEGYRIVDDGVYVSQSEMRQIFDPTVEKIKALIRRQLQAYAEKTNGRIPIAVVLLGCFSENAYVLRCIKEEFDTKLRIERASGEKFCMVSNGGIIASGNKDFIRERRALISYGFSQDIDWDPDIHDERLTFPGPNDEIPDDYLFAFPSPYDNKPMLKNRIKWAVRRGEALPQKYRHTLIGRRFLPVGRDVVHLKEDLFMSRVESRNDLPIYGDNDICKIASLEMSIREPRKYGYSSGAQRNQDKSSRHDWEVDYFLNTYLDGWILTWEVEIPPEGNIENQDHPKTLDSGWYVSGKQTFNIAAAFTPGTG